MRRTGSIARAGAEIVALTMPGGVFGRGVGTGALGPVVALREAGAALVDPVAGALVLPLVAEGPLDCGGAVVFDLLPGGGACLELVLAGAALLFTVVARRDRSDSDESSRRVSWRRLL